MRRSRAAAALGAVLVLLTACSGGSGGSSSSDTGAAASSGPTPEVGAPSTGPVVAGTITTGLKVPWGLAFVSDDSALVGERDTGLIKLVAPGSVRTVGSIPEMVHGGEGGLLGLAVSPSFDSNHYVYAYYSTKTDNRLVRMTYTDDRLGPQQVLLSGVPRGTHHNGGRIAFGPDGMLYVGTGDNGNNTYSQDKSNLGGKILRLTPDGRAAPGNPFDSPVWTLGHRNVQGLAWAPDGRMYADEFGQDTWDELNLIQKGHDYGWPVVEGRKAHPGFTEPLVQWPTDDASPSALTYAGGALWMAGLGGRRLWRIPVSGGRVTGRPQSYLAQYGRLRTVAAAPDGSLWLMTNNTDGRGTPKPGDDRILRLTLR